MAETAEPEVASTPTSNDELGVLGARAAQAEQAARARMAQVSEARAAEQKPRPELGVDPQMRLSVLKLAQEAPGAGIVSAADVVARAATYLTFVKGEANG